MPQRSLCHYFPSMFETFQASGTSFLDLPYGIRHRIYILAGLVRFCPIDLNLEGAGRKDYIREILNSYKMVHESLYPQLCFYFGRRFCGKYQEIEEKYDCICPPLPYQLLYVSHCIHDEVSSILYSQNSFRISRSNQWGLKPLNNFNPRALAALTSITIRLNSISCVVYHDCAPPPRDCGCHSQCNRQGLHDRPIGHTARQDLAVLAEWNRILKRFTTHVQPHHLSLSVVCDVKDLEMAQRVLEPLSKLSSLRNCAIRLGQKPNWALRNLAERAARQAMGDLSLSAIDSSFRSYHLPEEILNQILGYTDLIAPFDLEWRSDKGLVPFDCCKKCTSTLEVCCCSFYHAAFASTCDCWRIPISLFLVSRRVQELASHIFFTRNHFVVLPRLNKDNSLVNTTPSSMEISRFLASLPACAWKDLQSVRWILPCFGPDYLLAEEHGTLDWQNTIQKISEKADLPKLNITIDMAGERDRNIWPPIVSPDEYQASMWIAYQRIIAPMVQLKGLRNMFVHLTWPRWSDIEGLREKHEQVLERLIMGKEYNAIANGKFRKRRLWNDGWSDEGPVYGPHGCLEWPLDFVSNERLAH